MKQVIRLFTIGVCALAVTLLTITPSSAQIPDEFTNLKVLDKEIGKQQLIDIMRTWAGSLGVRCNHCHEGPANLQGMDFATDSKEHKRAARTMLEMVMAINGQYIGSWEESAGEGQRTRVTCFTCHRGQSEPPRKLTSILSETVANEGVDAAMAQYKDFRTQYSGTGLYDFRERVFGDLAQEAFESGKMDVAVQILNSSLEIYPESADLHSFLGMAYLQSGDTEKATAKFDEALKLDPENVNAMRGKRMLEQGQK